MWEPSGTLRDILSSDRHETNTERPYLGVRPWGFRVILDRILIIPPIHSRFNMDIQHLFMSLAQPSGAPPKQPLTVSSLMTGSVTLRDPRFVEGPGYEDVVLESGIETSSVEVSV